MKIDKAIHSVNNNKSYLDFWEPVSMIWKEKFGIEPVLYYFYKNYFEEDITISERYGKVHRIKLIEGIPDAIQIMWARYYMPSEEADSIQIISDIDMFPISKKYFIDQLVDIEDNKYVHINPCIESYGTLPSCYHIAKGFLYKKYLDLPGTWEESILQVIKSGFGKTINGNDLWFADEEYATNKILKNKDNNVIFLKRKNGQDGFRIDRSNWHYNADLVLRQEYYDAHSIRPFENNKKEIEKLINLIMESN
jgi:hypothetical protein